MKTKDNRDQLVAYLFAQLLKAKNKTKKAVPLDADAESFQRITDTLQHYGQLRSSSAVQSVKDLCHEYETAADLLSKNNAEGDRLTDQVRFGIAEFDKLQQQYEALHAAQVRDAESASALQQIAAMLSEATGGHDDFLGTDQVVAGVKAALARAKEVIGDWHEVGVLLYDSGDVKKGSTLTFRTMYDAVWSVTNSRKNLADDVRTLQARSDKDALFFGTLNEQLGADFTNELRTPEQFAKLFFDLRAQRDEARERVKVMGYEANEREAELNGQKGAKDHFEKKADTFQKESFANAQYLSDVLGSVGVDLTAFCKAYDIESGIQNLAAQRDEARHNLKDVTTALRDNDTAVIHRLAAAIAKVNGVDLGDPSSVDSLEAAILNLGWDRDRRVLPTPAAEAGVLALFLAASANLQAEADHLIGKYLVVRPDALELAKRDGAINPNWLDWFAKQVGTRGWVNKVSVDNGGGVNVAFETDSFFMFNVKYCDVPN